MNHWTEFLIAYAIVGMLFILAIKADLKDTLYRDLTLYYYNWSKTIQQQQFIIYMFVVVFLFWPLFAVALLLDIIGVKPDNNEEL